MIVDSELYSLCLDTRSMSLLEIVCFAEFVKLKDVHFGTRRVHIDLPDPMVRHVYNSLYLSVQASFAFDLLPTHCRPPIQTQA